MKHELIFNENSAYLLVECVDPRDAESVNNQYKYISRNIGRPFSMLIITVDDWNSQLSPWQAKAVFGNADFGGRAGETLRYTEELLPKIITEYGFSDNTEIVIGGYSLAALFALWCGYESGLFDGVAAASPSVWFDGWLDYISDKEFKAKAVYLSLGDKEEKTKNQRMAAVRRNIEAQYELLLKNGVKCVFELNEGNHFRDTDVRTAKAFLSVMRG